MRELFFEIPHDKSLPFYRRLSIAIRKSIREGKIRPGETLPSTRALASRFKVHRHTIMAALQELQTEGWITSEEKRCYQVNRELPDRLAKPVVNPQSHNRLRGQFTWSRSVEISELRYSRNYRHGFPSGLPELREFPMREFKSYLYDAIRKPQLLGYGPPEGQAALIEEVQTYLRRVRSVDHREVVITHGSQEAIFLLAQLLLEPGDNVGVEALGYPPAFEALRFSGARLIPIQIDAMGMDIESLRGAIERSRIKVLYLTPLHQYPTMATYTAARRLAIYDLAVKHKILILEDDYDHEFHYTSEPIVPMASDDPEGLILYVSTFSKVLFPAARIGYMAVPAPLGKEISKLKRIASRQNEHFLQDAIARWMKSGGFESHLRRMRRLYHSRRDQIVNDLQKYQNDFDIDWVYPDGGMSIWMNIKKNSTLFAKRADKHSLLVNPESSYRLDGKAGTHLRLGFAGQTEKENSMALKLLFSILNQKS